MFKTPKHRSFDYKPVYYDEQKERKAELQRLEKEAAMGEVSEERRLELLRGKLNQKWSAKGRSVRGQGTFSQKIRLITILAVLCGLVWFFFNWG